jgi:hypothetical protein
MPLLFNESTTEWKNISFNRETLPKFKPYFDFDPYDKDQWIVFFKNLQNLAQIDLSTAHSIQHSQIPKVAISAGLSDIARERVLSKDFNDIVGSVANFKKSDEIILTGDLLDGQKNWISNLKIADYTCINAARPGEDPVLIFVDLKETPHTIIDDYYTPIGMIETRPYSLRIDNQRIDTKQILGVSGTQQLFSQSNFASYCFITNHLGIIKSLFFEIQEYAEKFKCGADFDFKKLEIDICALDMLWEKNLPSVLETTLTHEFWNARNTQYAFSKKTLIKIVQLVLELGVSYYTDAHSEFSRRFRDALTYVSHMHPLYRFGQDFFMLPLEDHRIK